MPLSIGGPVYLVAFTKWSGNPTEFTQSVAELRTETTGGSLLHVPIFTSEELAKSFANIVNTENPESPFPYSVSKINYPYDALKILEHLQKRSFEYVSFDLEKDNDRDTVYDIAELHRNILASAG